MSSPTSPRFASRSQPIAINISPPINNFPLRPASNPSDRLYSPAMDNELSTNPKAPPTTAKSPAITGQTGALPVSHAKSGRFLPGNRANPHGRPKGSLNQATIFARALLEESAPAVARKAIEEAKQGNSIAMKLVLDRTIAPAQDRAVNLNLPDPGGVPDDILASHTSLVQAMATGEITPQEALIISQVLEARRRSWETTHFARRISKLEAHASQQQQRRKK